MKHLVLCLLLISTVFSQTTVDFYGCDYLAVAQACTSAAVDYATCVVSENVPIFTGTDYTGTDFETYLASMNAYLADVCVCVQPYLYCWMHSGYCNNLGSLLATYFNANCFGSCFQNTAPFTGATCDSYTNRWFIDGSVSISGSGTVFDATSTVEITGDFYISVDASVTVSAYGYVAAATVTINGATTIHIESQLSLDYLPYVTFNAGKRQDAAQKEILIANANTVAIADATNYEITFGTNPCATYDHSIVANETHIVLLLDNYDSSACSSDYNDYIQGSESTSSTESSTTEASSTTLLFSLFATLLSFF